MGQLSLPLHVLYQDMAAEKYGIVRLGFQLPAGLCGRYVHVSDDSFPWTGGVAGYGQNVDLSVDLLAPETPGNYEGKFMLLAPDGTYFGLGAQNKAFWVRIVVNVPISSPAFRRSSARCKTAFSGAARTISWIGRFLMTIPELSNMK